MREDYQCYFVCYVVMRSSRHDVLGKLELLDIVSCCISAPSNEMFTQLMRWFVTRTMMQAMVL